MKAERRKRKGRKGGQEGGRKEGGNKRKKRGAFMNTSNCHQRQKANL
jgi:hypothetical protein